jgi:hypothetical protein
MNELVASLKATGVDQWDVEHVKGEEQTNPGRELMALGKRWPGVGKLTLAANVKGGMGSDFAMDGEACG